MTTWDEELEDFKCRIDLRQYAAAQGYTLDRKESWRGSAVMRNAADKIVIKLDADNHYVFFSLRDERDNGSIIDFVMHRLKVSLGVVRKELRPWLGRATASPSATPALPLFAPLEKTTRDRTRVEMAYRRMQDAPAHPYLTGERHLSPALLASPRFAGRIRIDERGNAVFPHFDEQGLCGYELKNRGFTGFAPGGEKGLWFSRTSPGDSCLVLAESAIDALSYAELHPHEGTRYASIGGAVNAKQPGLIRAAAVKMPLGAEIISAMDNDAAGQALTAMVHAAVELAGRDDLAFRTHLPENPGDDWNQVMQNRHRPSFLLSALDFLG